MKKEKKTLVVALFGPTAVGKSRVAVELARLAGGEIISADSMQVYRGLPMLTDQPDEEMLAAVPHHLIAAISLGEEYSAARFAREARRLIAEIENRGSLPIVAGGTGLYIRALLGGFGFGGRAGHEGRLRSCDLAREEGLAAAVEELKRLDPAAAAAIDLGNHRRVIRALEAASTGRSVSEERDRLWSPDSPYEVRSFALTAPRAEVYSSIDARVGAMLAGGAVEEVREARAGAVSRTASQAIGFSDICEFLEGEVTLEEAAAAIKQKSRRYAKRQLTWMRKMPDIVRIDVAGRPAAEVAANIADHLK